MASLLSQQVKIRKKKITQQYHYFNQSLQGNKIVNKCKKKLPATGTRKSRLTRTRYLQNTKYWSDPVITSIKFGGEDIGTYLNANENNLSHEIKFSAQDVKIMYPNLVDNFNITDLIDYLYLPQK